MRENISPTERDVRMAILAPIAFILALGAGLTIGGFLALAFGLGMVLTALTGYSPASALVGRNWTAPAA